MSNNGQKIYINQITYETQTYSSINTEDTVFTL